MAFCTECGAYIPMEESICPACGCRIGEEKNKQTSSSSSGSTQQQTYTGSNAASAKQEEPWNRPADRDPWDQPPRNNTAGTQSRTQTGKSSSNSAWRAANNFSQSTPKKTTYTVPNDAYENRYLAMLCYLGPLFLIPLFMRQHSPFIRFHSNQGLCLFLASWIISLLSGLIPLLGWIVSLLGRLFWLFCMFKGISSAVKCTMEKLPIIGDFTLIR